MKLSTNTCKDEKKAKGYSSYKYTFKIDIEDAEVEDDMLKFTCEQCGDRTSIRLSDLSVIFSASVGFLKDVKIGV